MPKSDAPLRPTSLRPVALAQLATAARGEVRGSHDGIEASGITNRSGEVLPGDLYAALPGQRTHGANYAAQAIERGAVGVLTDAAGAELIAQAPTGVPVVVTEDVKAVLGQVAAVVYGDPSARLHMLGITATSGKTTTAYLMRAGLQAAGHTVGLIGTVETLIGDRTIAHTAGASFTTPEAPDLQALLAVMAEEGVTHVVMEVSSHALSLGRVGAIRFDVAGFGNLSQDHLDFHHTMQEYFEAKALLFDGRAARHVVNVDDEYAARVVAKAPERTVTVSSGGAAADWQAREQRLGESASTFTAHGPAGDVPVELHLPGDFNVANALLALAMLAEAGVPPQVAAPALSAVAVPGRMERIDEGQGYLAVVDYSHKPAAVQAAVRALRRQVAGNILLVLGCGGDRDAQKRPLMGEVGAREADLLVVTDDNPRSEDPAQIRAAMLAGARAVPDAERGEVIEEGDRHAAIELAVSRARAGDAVLVAGKGHETGQYVAGEVLPFDDRVELREAVRRSGAKS
ncbi:UDP-N-acetylmuramoyl-L-alanyl-D-glutamate--2,6-diaminopimelate ligase [Epidermidibacterium keratini]|uniref:UDP-N-acetylmuramoyl-L-alanyl-D-glutamate--2,6-diaminopimelate ligase n=1 Tax=Epidermidibacterium keratini TaxID=1891644 RepID=A0A7L4YJX5_9ACTN|nr:UDP-N-acetylmuramoyl-L-alanyl-D-glutamate--2,6-diaminopimelate ligase [Epidermidibacterium keratini]QHB99143.1 UDP-N-acetylmuramoyl-L-alanyl-D-glutamate--2,6-diaminopimelate ligase [Epidermidibacterium keratini]